ncbi:deazaflavin-dependent oxidoreductase (nitroreductase family) [Streptomyces aurantiacus]|uniref:nitroreductase/quinone reductase family protein n=1 Tax=Streptomyces aurantiacus TaxID=47760 RepID=UPI00278E58BD|nr:nitroreductase/quinone reductase family protein [Streptomyces aurantiacus]MDQ0775626.1 deazaflavin-dependent oxidoreductase (nitroreductase family) [Streptomyces aurantiacus]
MPNDFNQQVIEEFRANAGQVGGPFEGARLLLLTTTGARSGDRHTTPVGYYPDGDGRVLVIASAGGAPKHPDWFQNLVAHPHVTVESGAFTYDAKAEVLNGAARDDAFARAVEADSGWAEYQAGTSRVIPVVVLHPVARGGPPNINTSSMGQAVKAIHDAFRHELVLIRREIGEAGATLGAQLRVNCLAFCQSLHNHHTGEDTILFPFLAGRHPGLDPTLDRLRAEHEHIAALTAELKHVIGSGSADTRHVRDEVERLTTALEAHLAYEEAQLIPALDASAGPVSGSS